MPSTKNPLKNKDADRLQIKRRIKTCHVNTIKKKPRVAKLISKQASERIKTKRINRDIV